MEKQPNSRMCFVCGIDNPIGLHLSFYTDEEGRCIARFRPKPEHQGYPGHLHGGVISSLLDETMGRVLTHQNVWAMTGRLEVSSPGLRFFCSVTPSRWIADTRSPA